jgi:hypothetical protein
MPLRLTNSRWSLGRAFLAGAAVGVVVGMIWGTLDYGAFDPRFYYNHILGSIFILGILFVAVAAFLNWNRRHSL